MPPLTFEPEYERIMTLQAIGRCPREYHYIQEVRAGRMKPAPPSKALIIGLGMDAGIGALWAQSIAGQDWNPGHATDIAHARLYDEVEAAGQPIELEVFETITAGIHGYVAQWAGVPRWKPIITQPAESSSEWRKRCELALPELTFPHSYRFLAMPDLVARDQQDDTLLIVDHKTGAFDYDAAEWATSIQLMTYAYVLEQNTNEPVRYIVDYMKKPGRPTKAGPRAWEYPLTAEFSLTPERTGLVKEWLAGRCEALDLKARSGQSWRNADACHRRYGLCDYWASCVGAL